MPYDPLKHNRQSIRTKGHDYTLPGYYFVTICTQYRLQLLGNIVNQQMYLNPAGNMVDFWWRELENKFPNIRLNEYVIMPDHFHGIIEITKPHRGADLRVCPETGDVCPEPGTISPAPNRRSDLCVCPEQCRRSDLRVCPEPNHVCLNHTAIHASQNQQVGTHASQNQQVGTHASQNRQVGTHTGVPLGTMVQWFKTMSTNAYMHGVNTDNWPRFKKRLWHRNYFDRIIVNKRQLYNVINYIRMNPSNWKPRG